jgi:hypothetical protein
MDTATTTTRRATAWNKGKLLGQKPPLKLKEIWAIRIRLQLEHRTRELALFNLAIDSKLRGQDSNLRPSGYEADKAYIRAQQINNLQRLPNSKRIYPRHSVGTLNPGESQMTFSHAPPLRSNAVRPETYSARAVLTERRADRPVLTSPSSNPTWLWTKIELIAPAETQVGVPPWFVRN